MSKPEVAFLIIAIATTVNVMVSLWFARDDGSLLRSFLLFDFAGALLLLVVANALGYFS